MKRDYKNIGPRDFAISLAVPDHPKIRRRPCFPSYERYFSTLFREAAQKIRAFFAPRGRHAIVTFTLQLSISGVI